MRWVGEKVIVSRLDELMWAESFNPYPPSDSNIRAPYVHACVAQIGVHRRTGFALSF
jgi:hypothetical protein